MSTFNTGDFVRDSSGFEGKISLISYQNNDRYEVLNEQGKRKWCNGRDLQPSSPSKDPVAKAKADAKAKEEAVEKKRKAPAVTPAKKKKRRGKTLKEKMNLESLPSPAEYAQLQKEYDQSEVSRMKKPDLPSEEKVLSVRRNYWRWKSDQEKEGTKVERLPGELIRISTANSSDIEALLKGIADSPFEGFTASDFENILQDIRKEHSKRQEWSDFVQRHNAWATKGRKIVKARQQLLTDSVGAALKEFGTSNEPLGDFTINGNALTLKALERIRNSFKGTRGKFLRQDGYDAIYGALHWLLENEDSIVRRSKQSPVKRRRISKPRHNAIMRHNAIANMLLEQMGGLSRDDIKDAFRRADQSANGEFTRGRVTFMTVQPPSN